MAERSNARRKLAGAWASLAFLALAALAPSAPAAEPYQAFIPFLRDLPGWTAETPEGVSMQSSAGSMVTASRQYVQGDKRLTAALIKGAETAGIEAAGALSLETTESKMTAETIDGFYVNSNFSKADKTGTVLVVIGGGALFSIEFENVTLEDALALSKRFDWKAMKRTLAP